MSVQRLSLSRLVLSLALLVPLGACNPDHATQPSDVKAPQLTLITTLLVSAPSTLNAAQQLQLSVRSAGEDSYAYISASPGTTPGVTAWIINRTRDRQSTTPTGIRASIKDGGFDPVRVPASAGDTLQIECLSSDGSVVLLGAVVVPRLRPPAIVRTNPRSGKRDVPLNSHFEIVFSEPIDPATINPQNIRLIAGSTRIDGSLVQTDAFTVEFIPAEPLSPATPFVLVIGPGVHNLGGINLESESSIPFETDSGTTGCSADAECISFVRDGKVYITALLRSGTTGTLIGGSGATLLDLNSYADAPVWSPDGRQLAFVNEAWNQLCVVPENGLGRRCLNVFSDSRPSWSPDGSELAFVGSVQPDNPNQPRPRQLFALKVSDMSLRVILPDAGPICGTGVSWSPDGSRIAITSFPSVCGGLATVGADGSGLRVLAQRNPAQPFTSIAWSPDGKRFAVLAFDEIGTLDVDGTGWQSLVTSSSLESAEIIEALTWSRDGSAILFSAGWNCFMGCTDNRIMFVKRDGSRGTVLLNARAPTVRAPVQ